jgi:cytochrome c556
MKKIVASLLVLFFAGALMLSCSSSSESPSAVFKEMGNQIDELVGLLEKNRTDPAAAALALQGYLDKNGTKLKDLAEKAKQIGQKIKDDPKLQQEVMMHALGMIGKAGKLNNVVRDLTKDPGFNAVWTKYQQISR